MRVQLLCSDHTEPTTHSPMYSFVNNYNTEMCADDFQFMECVIKLVFAYMLFDSIILDEINFDIFNVSNYCIYLVHITGVQRHVL